jgi:hypothetical protein
LRGFLLPFFITASFSKTYTNFLLPSIKDQVSLDALFFACSKEVVDLVLGGAVDTLPCIADVIMEQDQENQVDRCFAYLRQYCDSIVFDDSGAIIGIQSHTEDDISDDECFHCLAEYLFPHSHKKYCLITTTWYESGEGMGSSASIGRLVNGSFVLTWINDLLDELLPSVLHSSCTAA